MKNYYTRLLLAVLLLGISAPAAARIVTLSWTRPTAYEDGVALPVADIASYRVFVDGVLNPVVVTGAALTAVVDVPSGSRTFAVSAVTTLTSRGEGSVSALSNVVTKVIVAPRPNPPTLLDAIIAFLKRVFNQAFA